MRQQQAPKNSGESIGLITNILPKLHRTQSTDLNSYLIQMAKQISEILQNKGVQKEIADLVSTNCFSILKKWHDARQTIIEALIGSEHTLLPELDRIEYRNRIEQQYEEHAKNAALIMALASFDLSRPENIKKLSYEERVAILKSVEEWLSNPENIKRMLTEPTTAIRDMQSTIKNKHGVELFKNFDRYTVTETASKMFPLTLLRNSFIGVGLSSVLLQTGLVPGDAFLPLLSIFVGLPFIRHFATSLPIGKKEIEECNNVDRCLTGLYEHSSGYDPLKGLVAASQFVFGDELMKRFSNILDCMDAIKSEEATREPKRVSPFSPLTEHNVSEQPAHVQVDNE